MLDQRLQSDPAIGLYFDKVKEYMDFPLEEQKGVTRTEWNQLSEASF